MTFSRFLRSQQDRADWIGKLARAAANDSRFPWVGEPLDMIERVRQWRAGSEPWHALNAALDEWHGGPYPIERDRKRRAAQEAARRDAAYEAEIAAEAERKRVRRNMLARARLAKALRG